MTIHASAGQPTGAEPAPRIRLGARDVHKYYGEVHANRGISFEVRPGEIHAVVGENGAGKSTLMRILQGLEQPDQGGVIVDDREVRLTSPRHALSLGIGMVHQEFMLAGDLSLIENFVLGAEPVKRRFGAFASVDWQAAIAAGDELASRAGIAMDWTRSAGGSPVHTQQFLEIIRLLYRGARILILDEPTAVLAPPQVNDLFLMLRALRDGGATIVFISHKIREVMAFADRVTVIRRGEVTYRAAIAETDEATISRHIMGETEAGEPVAAARAVAPVSVEPVLSVAGLGAASVEKSHPLHDLALDVRAGEIVGLAGVSGNGQVELLECLMGLRRADGGSVSFRGEDVSSLSTAGRRSRGIGFVSPDRAHEGLAVSASVMANAIAGSHRSAPIKAGPFMRLGKAREIARERLSRLGVRYGQLSDPAASLSGGNQQRLVFAREIAGAPSLLIVSQPTRGVDLNGIAAIHSILRGFRDEGGAVLLVSEELDELIELCDRVVVMADGRIVGEQPREGMDIQALGRMMVLQGAEHG